MTKIEYIYFPESFLNENEWTSDYAVIKELAKLGVTLSIPYNFTLLKSLKTIQKNNKLFQFFLGQRIEILSKNLYQIVPKPLMHFGMRKSRFSKYKNKIYLKEFDRFINNSKMILSKYNFKNAIIFTSTILAHKIKSAFPNNKVLYYVVDDRKIFDSLDYNFVYKNEKLCANNCDHIITVSDNLTKMFYDYGANVIQSHIGLTPLRQMDRLNINVLNNNNKCTKVGFIGRLAPFVDFELINKMLITFPNICFVVVGPLKHNKKNLPLFLRNHDRVILIDSYPVKHLLGVMKNFDICILPFKKNKITISSDPIKMFDYIQTNLPIIARNINRNMRKYDGYVSLYENHEDFFLKMDAILNQNYTYKNRNELYNIYNWETVIKEILKNIK